MQEYKEYGTNQRIGQEDYGSFGGSCRESLFRMKKLSAGQLLIVDSINLVH